MYTCIYIYIYTGAFPERRAAAAPNASAFGLHHLGSPAVAAPPGALPTSATRDEARSAPEKELANVLI